MENEKLDAAQASPSSLGVSCTWVRAFDGHFNISCPSGERGNGQFKPDDKHRTKWDFKFCPYCGRPIELGS